MKQFIFILMILSTIAFTFAMCTPSEKIVKTTTCDTKGTFKDLTGKLAGCTFLIELEDGTRLLPVEYTIDIFDPKDGQKINFSYEEIDAMTNCMAGKTVKVTCLTLVD